MAVMQRKQHHRGRPRVTLPSQQEIGEEGDERSCQERVGKGASSVSQHVGPGVHLSDRHNVRRFRLPNRITGVAKLFSVLLKGLYDGSDFLRIFWQVIG